jgi:N-acetylmuramoyl-L-alanine amidase
MSKILTKASLISTAATLLFALIVAAGPGVAAQRQNSGPQSPALITSNNPVETINEPLDGVNTTPLDPQNPEASSPNSSTLAELVSAQVIGDELSPQMKCLAGAIYFEAKSESLEGQLAVGRVVINRAKSGRFPASYCGVVYQHSQFSFVRGAAMPAINAQSRLWYNAVAIAQIADADMWQSEAEGALFFHAARVSPRWNLRRIARVENHIFYQ